MRFCSQLQFAYDAECVQKCVLPRATRMEILSLNGATGESLPALGLGGPKNSYADAPGLGGRN